MSEPVAIFDPARWCESWLLHGGSIDAWRGHVRPPLSIYLGADTVREQLLVRLYRQLTPSRRAAVSRFVQSDRRWRHVQRTRCQWLAA